LRRAELINALASDSPAHKRRSSVADLALLSMSGSFLDNTDKNLLTPEPPQQQQLLPERTVAAARERRSSEPETVSVPVFNMKTATPRQQVRRLLPNIVISWH
jgi:hypothetical protein